MSKFQRNYSLAVQDIYSTVQTFTLPLTLEFNVIRDMYTSASSSTFKLYNLTLEHRNLLRKNLSDWTNPQIRSITLKAGYGQNIPILFTGNVHQAWSERDGVDFTTTLESFDLGFAFVNAQGPVQPFPKGTANKVQVATLISTLPGVKIGALGKMTGTSQRGASYAGSIVDTIKQLTDGSNFFVDNGKAYVLGDYEVIQPQGGIPVIDADTGLLAPPHWEEYTIIFKMLLEPSFIIGQLVTLKSADNPILNGTYKIVALKHHGTISDAVCGDAITEVTLFAPQNGSFVVVPEAA